MIWQQSLVVLWIQFAVGTAGILFVTRLALRWVPQPVERTRLIQGMLIAVLMVPLLSTLVPLPYWNLDLISIKAPPVSTTEAIVRSDSPMAIRIEDPVDLNDADQDAARSINGARAKPLQASKNSSLDSRKPFQSAVAAADGLVPGTAVTGNSKFNVWSALVFAIFLAHFVAAVYFVFEQLLGQVRLASLCRVATNAPDTVCQNWKTITANRGDRVRLLVSSNLNVPLTFGWLRPTIVVPSSLASQDGTELNACLEHEWSHIERDDMLTCYFLNLCQFVLWYQPGFWSLRRELRISQEFVADARSSGKMTPIEYAEFLLQMAKVRRPSLAPNALTLFDQPSQLSRRIKMLLESQTALIDHCRVRFTWVMLIVATFLAVTISSLRLGSARAEDPAAAAQQTRPVSRNLNAAQPDADVKPEPALIAEPAKAEDADKDEQPKYRSLTYQKTIVTKGTQQPAVVKEYLAEDGRKRSELAGGTVSIFDKAGNIRITLTSTTKTAFVRPPNLVPLPEIKAAGKLRLGVGLKRALSESRNGFEQRRLENLKKLCESPSEKLGQKEVAGRLANGFIVDFAKTLYTVWLDATSGELVQVEYDASSMGMSMHITDSQFQFDQKFDESLFSVEVPAGYKIHQPLKVTNESDSEERRKAEAPVGMERIWTQNNGSWKVAANPLERRIYSCNLGGVLMTFDDRGKTQSSFSPGNSKLLRAVDLDGDGKCELVTAAGLGGSTVNAYRLDGELLWTYARGDEPGHDWSVNDICLVDLNADGKREVIIGFNGATGLHVLDSGGKRLRKDTTVQNVWHVAAGRIEPLLPPEVVSTSADGKVHRFDNEGKVLHVLDVGCYANMIRVWQPSGTDQQQARIIVGGTVTNDANKKNAANSDQVIAAFDSQGTRQWSLDLPKRVVSAITCESKPWLAVSLADGTVRTIDVATGKEIARVGGQGEMTDVAWLTATEGDPLLIVGNGTALTAFKVDAEKPE